MRRLSEERGSVTFWMLGLALFLLTLGGLSLDLWRLVAERREVAAVVDAAAVAAASGIDEPAWREQGELRLDPDLARQRAVEVIASQPAADEVLFPPGWLVVDPGADSVTVVLATEVEFTLLRLVHPQPVRVEASARASARSFR